MDFITAWRFSHQANQPHDSADFAAGARRAVHTRGGPCTTAFRRFHSNPARGARIFRAKLRHDWARSDSNREPRDYESPALTVELRARGNHNDHFTSPPTIVMTARPFTFQP